MLRNYAPPGNLLRSADEEGRGERRQPARLEVSRRVLDIVQRLTLAMGASLTLSACDNVRSESSRGPAEAVPRARAESLDSDVRQLPRPNRVGRISLEQVLASRRSVREFAPTPLTDVEHSQLLWATQGISDQRHGLRTAPSAGALYPLELYLATSEGVFHYEPQSHRLRRHSSTDVRARLHEAAHSQEAVRSAPSVFVMTAVHPRTARRYGEARGARYVAMEIGHAAQNLLLQATAMGLGAGAIGAFDDAAVQEALDLRSHEPLYLIPVGHPDRSDVDVTESETR